MSRQIALRALKHLCTFIGAIALFSYFYNWTVDIRHWYVTLASALACAILWLGFYVIEVQGGVRHVVARVASGFSRLRTKPELPSPAAQVPVLPADPPANSPANPPTSNPLPWLKRASG
jgi:hypothetical protein